MTKDERDSLATLSWYYAAIVGIIDPAAIDLTDGDVEGYRKRWPHLVQVEDGLPVFCDEDGAAFMSEVSGVGLEDCLRVLRDEWPGPDADPADLGHRSTGEPA